MATRKKYIRTKRPIDRIRNAWRHMMDRCYKPGTFAYEYYGGAGIGVCDEWRQDRDAFIRWAMANGYDDALELDRIDNTKGYSPENCRWTDGFTQAKNRRSVIYATAWGETKILADWARDPRCKVKYLTLLKRVNSGWDHERALTARTHHRLTADDIPIIRQRIADGFMLKDIANEFGVSPELICGIKQGRAWKDVA